MTAEHDFDLAWPLIGPALKYSDGALTKETVWRAIDSGEYMLWTNGKGAIVWKISTDPSGQKTAFIMLAGGDLAFVLELEALAATEARGQGCTKIRFTGRNGWTRHAPGYTDLGRIYTKDL